MLFRVGGSCRGGWVMQWLGGGVMLGGVGHVGMGCVM